MKSLEHMTDQELEAWVLAGNECRQTPRLRESGKLVQLSKELRCASFDKLRSAIRSRGYDEATIKFSGLASAAYPGECFISADWVEPINAYIIRLDHAVDKSRKQKVAKILAQQEQQQLRTLRANYNDGTLLLRNAETAKKQMAALQEKIADIESTVDDMDSDELYYFLIANKPDNQE